MENTKPVNNMEVLQKPKAVDIMLALFQTSSKDLNEPISLPHSDLSCVVGGSNATINVRLYDLRIQGLIIENKEQKYQGRRLIKLTPMGIMTAYYLKCAKDTMEGIRVKPGDRPHFVKAVEGSLWTRMKGYPIRPELNKKPND